MRTNEGPTAAKRPKKSRVESALSSPTEVPSGSSATIPKAAAPAGAASSGSADLPKERHHPEFIKGQAVRLDIQTNGAIGLKISCPIHPKCTKWRSVDHVNDSEFGDLGIQYYFECWVSGAEHMTPERHRAWRPKPKDVHAYINGA